MCETILPGGMKHVAGVCKAQLCRAAAEQLLKNVAEILIDNGKTLGKLRLHLLCQVIDEL